MCLCIHAFFLPDVQRRASALGRLAAEEAERLLEEQHGGKEVSIAVTHAEHSRQRAGTGAVPRAIRGRQKAMRPGATREEDWRCLKLTSRRGDDQGLAAFRKGQEEQRLAQDAAARMAGAPPRRCPMLAPRWRRALAPLRCPPPMPFSDMRGALTALAYTIAY
jgi:hypothetical protein